MNIYVINHTEFNQEYPENYIPMLVGSVNKEDHMKENVLTDDTGINISDLNDSYCELTGLYWIWKNVTEPIVGLVHYRRFFLGLKYSLSFHDDLFVKNADQLSWCHLLTSAESEKILNKHDIIVKVSHRHHFNMQVKLLQYIPEECLKNLNKVLLNSNRNEYDAFQKYLKRYSMVLFNMFIGKKQLIDQYCEWLFPLLEKVDQLHIDATGERYKNRELGYLGEVLFGFWLDYNKISCFAADTLMPRKSDITEVAGIHMPNGSNVYSIKQYPIQFVKFFLRLFKHHVELDR